MHPIGEIEFDIDDFTDLSEPTKKYRIVGWSADGIPVIIVIEEG